MVKYRSGKGNTIEKVVSSSLCTGCGTCVSACPLSAIRMVIDDDKGVYLPEVDQEKCNRCGICHRVCTGHMVDFDELNRDIFGKEPEDVLMGNYSGCYLGYASDQDMRYRAASGGLVTALLIYALKEGIIDGALVTRMKKHKPLEPEPFIARTPEEIVEAAKSKYCPVPANIALRDILDVEGRYAVVGLPCHLHGVRKLEMVDRKLKDSIVLHLGIFCSYSPKFLATEYLLYRGQRKKEDVAEISYRGDGWPGGISICFKDGRKAFYPHHDLWSTIFGSLFSPFRCTLCCDQSSELADISFCDAWLPEIMKEANNMGTSLVVSRTDTGKEFLQRAISNDNVVLREILPDKLKQSQNYFSYKKSVRTRLFILRLFGHRVPVYKVDLPKVKFKALLTTPVIYFNLNLSSRRYLWRFIPFYIRVKQSMHRLLGL